MSRNRIPPSSRYSYLYPCATVEELLKECYEKFEIIEKCEHEENCTSCDKKINIAQEMINKIKKELEGREFDIIILGEDPFKELRRLAERD